MRLYTPLCRSVGPSVRPSHFFLFFYLNFWLHCSCPNDLMNYSPCPRARDWGSRVSGLVRFFCGLWPNYYSCPNDQVTSNTAPTHPHVTRVAMYPALFSLHDWWRKWVHQEWDSDSLIESSFFFFIDFLSKIFQIGTNLSSSALFIGFPIILWKKLLMWMILYSSSNWQWHSAFNQKLTNTEKLDVI